MESTEERFKFDEIKYKLEEIERMLYHIISRVNKLDNIEMILNEEINEDEEESDNEELNNDELDIKEFNNNDKKIKEDKKNAGKTSRIKQTD